MTAKSGSSAVMAGAVAPPLPPSMLLPIVEPGGSLMLAMHALTLCRRAHVNVQFCAAVVTPFEVTVTGTVPAVARLGALVTVSEVALT